MKGIEQRAQSHEVYGSYKKDRLRGKELSNAKGDGHSLIVAYGHNAIKFDVVVSSVGRTITGAQLVNMAVRDPKSERDFYLTLKGRGGVVPGRALQGTPFEQYGNMPGEAILSQDQQLDPDAEAHFTEADEQRFQALFDARERGRIAIAGGMHGIPPTPINRRP